jgi:V/A-type H+-transporting ATPase subunit E
MTGQSITEIKGAFQMTGTEKIKSRILEDARAKAAEIEEQARQEAGAIMDQANKEAGLKRAEILKKAEADSQEAYRRLTSSAALEGRKDLLRAKQDMVEAAFQSALERIVNLPDREYQKLMEDMAVNAALKDGGEILLSERDRSRLDGNFLNNVNKRLQASGMKGKLVLSKDAIRSMGGFILKSGDMEVNSTLEILFGMLRPELENDVVKILFGT